MRILFITHIFPYPLDDGIKVTAYNLIKCLSKKHKVTLVSLIEKEEENNLVKNIGQYCEKVETVLHKIPKHFAGRLMDMLFSKEPYCVNQFYSKIMDEKLSKLCKTNKYDIAHFHFINTTKYIQSTGLLPKILFLHDSMSMLFSRNAKQEINILRKIYMNSQAGKMMEYEKHIQLYFKNTVVVSGVDRDYLINNKLAQDTGRLKVIPIGVDSEYFKPGNAGSRNEQSVIFRGVMNFFPNTDAALYFFNDILPIVRRKLPELKYYIVGKNTPDEIKRLAEIDDKTIVVGYVDDIRPYIEKALINISPMRTGSGIKIKILEAMSMAKPVVATRLACSGIEGLKYGENILTGDTPEEFAERIVELVKDEQLRRKIGDNSRKLVVERYTWENTSSRFEKIYTENTLIQ